jgi:hypothetical protein
MCTPLRLVDLPRCGRQDSVLEGQSAATGPSVPLLQERNARICPLGQRHGRRVGGKEQYSHLVQWIAACAPTSTTLTIALVYPALRLRIGSLTINRAGQSSSTLYRARRLSHCNPQRPQSRL